MRPAGGHGRVREPCLEPLQGNVGVEAPARSYGDVASVFGNHHRQRVGVLGDADRGAMTGAEILYHHRISGQGQEAGRCSDTVALNDYGAIVQSAAALKNSAQQITRDLGV